MLGFQPLCLIFLSQVVRHWARAENEKVVKYFKKLGNTRVLFYTRVVKYLPGGKVLSQKRKYFTRVVKFKPRINTGFSLYFTSFGFQVGVLCHLRRARQEHSIF